MAFAQTTRVYGEFTYENGTPIQGVTVTARPDKPIVEGSNTSLSSYTFTSGADGKLPASALLPRATLGGSNPQVVLWTFTVNNNGDVSTTKHFVYRSTQTLDLGRSMYSVPSGTVTSVAGRVGDVSLSKTDVGLGNVTNVAPADLPISTAVADALEDKAAATDLLTVQDDITAVEGSTLHRGTYAVLVEDDFSLYPDGPINGKAPRIGPNWVTSGTVSPQVVNGKLFSTGNGYAYQVGLTAVPIEMIVEGTFSGTDPSLYPLTTAIGTTDSNGAFEQVIHPIYSPRGFTLQLKEKNNAEFVVLMTGLWDQPCRMDDTTKYRFHITVRGSTATIIGPNGETFTRTDPRLRRVGEVANLAYYQPVSLNSGASVFKAGRVLVVGMSAAGALALGDDVLDRGRAATSDTAGRTAGSEGSFGEVKIGRSPVYDMPSIQLGAGSETVGPIRTVLTADAAVGATTISTVHKIPPNATIRFDGAGGAETATASAANPGGSTGAATRALTAATTILHRAGTTVVAIPTTTAPYGRSRELRYDTTNDYLYLWDALVTVAPGFLAVGGTDVYLRRVAASVMGLGVGSSFQADGTWNGGQFRMGNYRFWVDTNGLLRMKNGAPTSDTDGTVVGSQA